MIEGGGGQSRSTPPLKAYRGEADRGRSAQGEKSGYIENLGRQQVTRQHLFFSHVRKKFFLPVVGAFPLPTFPKPDGML